MLAKILKLVNRCNNFINIFDYIFYFQNNFLKVVKLRSENNYFFLYK